MWKNSLFCQAIANAKKYPMQYTIMLLEEINMTNKKVVVLGGGVLGTQIGLMCAYYGYDTTF